MEEYRRDYNPKTKHDRLQRDFRDDSYVCERRHLVRKGAPQEQIN